MRVGAEIIRTAVSCVAEAQINSTRPLPKQRVGDLPVEVIQNANRRIYRRGHDVIGQCISAIGIRDNVISVHVFCKMPAWCDSESCARNVRPIGEYIVEQNIRLPSAQDWAEIANIRKVLHAAASPCDGLSFDRWIEAGACNKGRPSGNSRRDIAEHENGRNSNSTEHSYSSVLVLVAFFPDAADCAFQLSHTHVLRRENLARVQTHRPKADRPAARRRRYDNVLSTGVERQLSSGTPDWARKPKSAPPI